MQYARLDGETVTLVVGFVPDGHADLLYCGPRLDPVEDLAALRASGSFGAHESQPDAPPVGGLLPERKDGFAGPPAVELRYGGRQFSTDFRPVRCEANADRLTIEFADAGAPLSAELEWRIHAGDVIVSRVKLNNGGDREIAVDRLASLALPVPPRFDRITSYAGRWAGEMREDERGMGAHGFASRSRRGKPGFDGGNWLILGEAGGDAVIGVHLAWSGDYETVLEVDADGRAMLMIAAALEAGEMVIPPGGHCTTPAAVFAYAADRSMLAQSFHRYVRETILPDRRNWRARKVHLNSWEAIGFDMDAAKLIALAEEAATLGVERFVLDDGWFGSRRNDRSSLGDWTVSADVLPEGLDSLIDRIEGLGMDFGLWVEPEMISPDSDLYRAHPDWCLHEPRRERPTQRHQLVLDLSQPAVTDHLFGCLDALLSAHRIAHLKWDHNRDLFPAANIHGPAGYDQTLALYALIDRLRAKHRDVEIESCSSGGGRIDFGILSRTHRVWTSDNNDAIERLRINAAWAQFLPLEVIGSHVGPSANPITGRRLDMDFRAKAALFGHMGVEADPGAMTDAERAVLRAHIALYKDWRAVLHGGALFRLDHPDPGVSGLLAWHDASGLALATQSRFAPNHDVAPVRLAGLDPAKRYRVTLPEPWPGKASRYLADADGWRAGHILSGRVLMERGIALPLAHPETGWLIALERMDR